MRLRTPRVDISWLYAVYYRHSLFTSLRSIYQYSQTAFPDWFLDVVHQTRRDISVFHLTGILNAFRCIRSMVAVGFSTPPLCLSFPTHTFHPLLATHGRLCHMGLTHTDAPVKSMSSPHPHSQQPTRAHDSLLSEGG